VADAAPPAARAGRPAQAGGGRGGDARNHQEQPGPGALVREEPGRSQPQGLPRAAAMSLQPFAFALADALMGAEPGAQPYRAIAFLLGRAGHERAGAVQPKELHRRTRKFAQLVNADLRTQKGLTYDP